MRIVHHYDSSGLRFPLLAAGMAMSGAFVKELQAAVAPAPAAHSTFISFLTFAAQPGRRSSASRRS